EAKLKLLEAGPRTEEVLEQRRRVERAGRWHELAREDLERARKSFDLELTRLGEQITQYEAELRFARNVCERALALKGRGGGAEEQFQEALTKLEVARTQAEQARARKQSLVALATPH